jgi:twitching motility protein PilT
VSSPYVSEAFLSQILSKALAARASDIYLEVGQPPGARVRGELVRFRFDRIAPEDVEAAAAVLFGVHPADVSSERVGVYTSAENGRLRVYAYRARGALGLILRPVPSKLPTLASLGMPAAVASWIDRPRGLVVVSGGVRSGKSTTMAAMVDQINETASKHVVTVENPVEHVHTPKKCNVSQREVGTDTESFLAGARAGIAQAPDVLVLGDLPNAAVVESAVEAAELGILVLAVLRAPTASRALVRLLFPERPGFRERMSGVLVGVVAQRLLVRRDTALPVLAAEVLVVNDAVRDVLCRKAGLAESEAALELIMTSSGTPLGMQTFESHLAAAANPR